MGHAVRVGPDSMIDAWLPLFAGTSALAVMSMGFRYRSGSPQERAQLKWFALATGVPVVLLVGGEFVGLPGPIVQIAYLAVPVAILLATAGSPCCDRRRRCPARRHPAHTAEHSWTGSLPRRPVASSHRWRPSRSGNAWVSPVGASATDARTDTPPAVGHSPGIWRPRSTARSSTTRLTAAGEDSRSPTEEAGHSPGVAGLTVLNHVVATW